MMMKFFRKLHRAKKLFIIGSIILFSGLFAGFQQNDFEIAKNLDIFYTLFREVNLLYVDHTDPAKLIESGIHGMLQSLDPYTNYIPEYKIEDYRFMQTGEYGGVGALFRQRDGKTYVVDPYEDSPASKAGMKAGDIVRKVDGKSIAGRSLDDLSEVFKGQPNTEVVMEIERPGSEELIELAVIREKIEMKSVPHYQMLDDKTAYIKLNSFTTKAFTEVKGALVELQKNQGAKCVVLDLRGNPGGLLIEAVKIVNLFVNKDQEVVSTRGKVEMQNKSYKTMVAPYDTVMPVVVLVNSKSASASEIVSGALQDLDRGIVIGTRTFGKGLVQQTRDLSYNSKLKVTIAKYYIPSGRCIQALDYTHRNEDGSVGKVPDSLITKFSTQNGREVYDGGGVMPDIEVKNEKLSKIAVTLYAKDIIFDYVTNYCLQHDSVVPPGQFAFTDAEYDEFKNFVATRNFSYATNSENAFSKLKKTAVKEKYYDKAKEQFDALEEILKNDLIKDMDTFKDDIVMLISEEILTRYYMKKGSIEYQLKNDLLTKKAVEVLADESTYYGVLSGKLKL
jgi:carboxyl-terminal processing protease